MFKRLIVIVCILSVSISTAVMVLSTAPVISLIQHGADAYDYDVLLTRDVVSYVTNWQLAVPTPRMTSLLTEAEQDHLTDVRTVYRLVRYIFLFSIAGAVACLLYPRARRALRRWSVNVRRLVTWTIIGMSTLLGVAFVAFDAVFTFMHQLLFADGTWQFEGTSRLLAIVPERFWFLWGMTLVILTISFLWCLQRFIPRQNRS